MRILFLLGLSLMPRMALAQDAPPALTVEEAVAQAIQKNPRLVAVAQNIAASEAGLRSARSLSNPTFFVSPAVPNTNGATEELLFTQPLELNGTRSARTGIARAQLSRVQAEGVTELRQVVFTVKTAYYELARAQEQLALARALFANAEEIDRLTRRQVELGSRPGIDQTQTGIEVVRGRQQVTLAEAQERTAAIALNVQMGRDPQQSVGKVRLAAINPQSSLANPAEEGRLPSPLREKGRDEGERRQFVLVPRLDPHPQPLSLRAQRGNQGEGRQVQAITFFSLPSRSKERGEGSGVGAGQEPSRTNNLSQTERLLILAEYNRAEIFSVQAERDRFRQEARMARAEGRPDLAPQFRSQNITRSFTPQDYGFSLVVTLPLFDWGSRRNRIRQAEESALAEEARRLAVVNQVKQEVLQAIARREAAEAVVKDFQSGGLLEQAQKLAEGSRKAFQTGAAGATVLSVLEAQRTLRSVQADYINAQVNAALAYIELERATGTIPPGLLRDVPKRGEDRK